MEKEDPLRNNVITFPTVISNGKRDVQEDISPLEAKQMAIDKIVEIGHTSQSVFALCIDREGGTPTLIMGGYSDPSFVNMFLDLVKDELKAMFRASDTIFVSDDELPDAE